MMHWKTALRAGLLAVVIVLAACAPDDLDITPSPTATNTPESTSTPAPTNTPAPTPTPDPNAPAGSDSAAAVIDAGPASLDDLLAALPGQLPAGALTWRRTSGDPTRRDVTGGQLGTVAYGEAQGSQAEVSFALFETPEAAQAFYAEVLGRVRTLENAETRDDLPQPNAFGGGTYGADAIIVRGDLYIRISIPQFSSTAGNPLLPMARAVNAIVDGVIGTP